MRRWWGVLEVPRRPSPAGRSPTRARGRSVGRGLLPAWGSAGQRTGRAALLSLGVLFPFSCFPFLSLLSSVVLLFLPCPSPLFFPFIFLPFIFFSFLSLSFFPPFLRHAFPFIPSFLPPPPFLFPPFLPFLTPFLFLF